MSRELIEILRKTKNREVDITDFLKISSQYIPPGEDYGVLLASTTSLSYYLDRSGIISVSRRLEEHLPYMSFTSRRIDWSRIPEWVLSNIDPCSIALEIKRLNSEWVKIADRRDPYYEVAEEISKTDLSIVCG
ncbi:MAG: hypothetical protein ABWJ42_00280 [Sulfolobales archaeon]